MAVILIIEDDIRISDQIETAIQGIDRNIKILKSAEGKRALQIAETMDIDIFIIDIRLPDWNGIELAKEIRKSYAYQPIIIESSESNPTLQMIVHDQIENLAFLSKPFEDAKMIVKVQRALDIARNIGTNQLKIKQNGFVRIIEIDDILYIEKVKFQKKIEMHLYNQKSQRLTKEIFAGLSLSSLLEMLKNDRDLFRCHKGYIINPKMIKKLNYADNSISLHYTEDRIPIGKTYKKAMDLLL